MLHLQVFSNNNFHAFCDLSYRKTLRKICKRRANIVKPRITNTPVEQKLGISTYIQYKTLINDYIMILVTVSKIEKKIYFNQ